VSLQEQKGVVTLVIQETQFLMACLMTHKAAMLSENVSDLFCIN